MLRLRLNCSVIEVEPCELVELIESIPAMPENCLLQGRRDGCGHGFRIRARQTCVHVDRGIVDCGEIADRQRSIANEAEQNYSDHHQRRRDRTIDEEFGDAVSGFILAWSSGCFKPFSICHLTCSLLPLGELASSGMKGLANDTR